MLMDIKDAFESFKFEIGDVVAHTSDVRNEGTLYVVIQRALIETPGGISKQYMLSGVGDGSFTAHELEMKHATYERG